MAAAAGITAVRIIRSAERGPVGVTVRRLGRRLERQATGAGRSLPRHRHRARRGRHARPAPPRPGHRPSGVRHRGQRRAGHPPRRGRRPRPRPLRLGLRVGPRSWPPCTDPGSPSPGRARRVPPRHLCRSRGRGVSVAIATSDARRPVPSAGCATPTARSAAATGSTWRSGGVRARSPRSRHTCPGRGGCSTSAAATAPSPCTSRRRRPIGTVTGVDVDADKLAAAREAARRGRLPVTFVAVAETAPCPAAVGRDHRGRRAVPAGPRRRARPRRRGGAGSSPPAARWWSRRSTCGPAGSTSWPGRRSWCPRGSPASPRARGSPSSRPTTSRPP